MFPVDVGDDRDRRRELQERPIALVGFRHHVLSLAQSRVAAERAEPAADDRGGIESRALEHQRDHRRGGRLAVRTGNRDAEAEAHQLGEHLRAGDDGDVPPPGFDQFGIVRRNRGRNHDDVGGLDMRGVVTGMNAHAKPRESIGDVRSTRVRSADLVLEVRDELGDSTHANTANPHEVHVPGAPEPGHYAAAPSV